MKIAVIKLGARITWDTDAAVGPGEAVSICKALSQGGADVHVFTKILAKDTLDSSITWHNILNDQDTTGLDALVIVNGTVNFFGGAEDAAQILNYKIINHFKGRIIYVMCDPELPLIQLWDNVASKQVNPRYGWTTIYSEGDINITRTDIQVLSQPFDLVKMRQKWNKNGVQIGGMFHFPMERFPLLNEWLDPATEPEVDLLYGGTTRGGRRVPNLYKWYWNLPSNFKVEIFGRIELNDFTKHPKIGLNNTLFKEDAVAPVFSGMVKYCNVLPKMNTALAHLVTGDPSYEELDIIPQRTMECIAAGNIVFVDASMDKSRRIYPAGTLVHDFLYVKTQAELIERLGELKLDPNLRQTVINGQREALNFNADEFCRSLVNAIGTT